MKNVDEIRRENLAALRDRVGGNAALADLLGKSEAQVSQWIRGSINSGTGKRRGMRWDTAREIEERCGLAPGSLDSLTDPPEPSSVPPPGPERPPVVPDAVWASLTPAVRALVETAVSSASRGELNDAQASALTQIIVSSQKKP